MRDHRTTAAFLPLSRIRSHLPEMDRRGVSTVCRGPGGFLEAYCDAEGTPERLPPWWHAKRTAFIARMHGQALLRGEPPRDERGRLTRRSLSLIAWAFDPELPGARRVASAMIPEEA